MTVDANRSRKTCLAVGLVLLMSLVWQGRADAQTADAPAGWTCTATACTEAAIAPFLEITGTFMAGAELSPADKADLIAALEQQSQREFEFSVNESAVITVTLTPDKSYRPDGWDAAGAELADPLLWVSDDGEDFARLTGDLAVQPGDVLLVAVRQVVTEGPEGTISYLPARWTLSLGQRRVVDEPGAIAQLTAPFVPSLVSADTDPVPEKTADEAGLPPVEGAVQLEAVPAPCAGADCETSAQPVSVDKELAVELQRELARVGCYTGEIDGLWGPASRAALSAFHAAQKSDVAEDRPTPRALLAVGRAQAPVCVPQ